LNTTPETSRSAATAAANVPAAGANIQPVPAAISVSVTGSRNNAGNGQRELFTEVTETVLLLAGGAVIRLSAPATPGQLLFLTNKESGREVVCRVAKYKNSPAGGGYAELEFTEAMSGFWGAHFPTDAARPHFPTSAEAFQAASRPAAGSEAALASRESASPDAPAKSSILTVEEAGKELLDQPTPEGPTKEQINAEINFLQEQLDALLGGKTPSQTARAPEAQPRPDSVAVTDALLKMLDTAKGKSPEAPETSSAANPGPSAKASVLDQLMAAPRPSEPAGVREGQQDPVEDEAPRPAFLQEEPSALPPRVHFTPPTRTYSLNKALIGGALAAGVLAAAGIVWHFHRAQAASAAEMSAFAGATANAAKMATRKIAASKKTAEPAPAAAPKQESEQEKAHVMNAASSGPPENTNAPAKDLHEEAAAELRQLKGKPAVDPASSRRTIAHISDTANANFEAGELVPAKLIKAVRAVAPPEATREYISGNVVIDAVVDASGRVGTLKILSGPEILHKAAEKALRQYEYQPATLNGKPTASHVTATIQFWYEP
jgi:TonB family protein